MANFFVRWAILVIMTLGFGIVAQAGDKKVAFDIDALQAAISSSNAETEAKKASVHKHREKRATASTKTGKKSVPIRLAGQYYGATDSFSSQGADESLRGLGERKNHLLEENTSIDFDSELQEVDVDPTEKQEK